MSDQFAELRRLAEQEQIRMNVAAVDFIVLAKTQIPTVFAALDDALARAEAAEVEVARLKEALITAGNRVQGLASQMAAPNVWTPQFYMLADGIRRAAYSPRPENGND